MSSENQFIAGTVIVGCLWVAVTFLYLFKIVPAIKKKRIWKTLIEVGLQCNFGGNIRQYGIIAKETNDRTMLKIYYLLNTLVVISMLFFLLTVLSTIESH